MPSRRRTEAHEKSMGSYEMFAWRDALAIAELICELYGRARAENVYKAVEQKEVVKFESENQQLIADFIQKSESQREPFLRRITKEAGDGTRIVFLTLALLGVLRAKALMELRDQFRTALAPGGGNRITTASLYDFSNALPSIYVYEWPAEPFDALGAFISEDPRDLRW